MKNLDNGNFLRSPVKDIQFGVNMVNTNIMNIQVIRYHTDFEPLSSLKNRFLSKFISMLMGTKM